MRVRIWNKKELKQTLNECKQANFIIINNNNFYEVYEDHQKQVLIFSALPMRGNYICRLNEEYFDV